MHCVLVAGSGNLDAQRKTSSGHSIVMKAPGWNTLAVKMCLSFQADSVGLTFILLAIFFPFALSWDHLSSYENVGLCALGVLDGISVERQSFIDVHPGSCAPFCDMHRQGSAITNNKCFLLNI